MDVCRQAIGSALLAGVAIATAACPTEQGRHLSVVDAALVPDAATRTPDAAVTTPETPVDTPDTAPPPRMCSPPAELERPVVRLSETGCVDPERPLMPGPGVVFYDVASPLWSDGASKQRWVFIPPGGKVEVGDGHFELPAGAVLIKHFSIAGRRIETRLITRSAGGWGTFSYRWNEDQSDAVVVGLDEGAVAREVVNDAGGKQIWTYPARTDCTKCHTDEAGFQLGLDLLQLNTVVRYPDGTTTNQLDHWHSKGLFAAAPPRPYPAALPLPTGAGGTLEARARSYLHANCANCHRPGTQFPLMDLRWETAFADTQTCNATPSKGDMGVAGAKRIVPGRPGQSLVSLRMHTLQERFRMPQTGTAVFDAQGAKVVDDWIASLPPDCAPR